ncbi:MAG: hypothetical protein ACPGVT_08125 [Maricaulaceae bacterium]
MKVFLTETIVDNAKTPEQGEYWISDTKIRGFGLRVWRSPNGSVKKAYALRIKGASGKTIRKTFSPYQSKLGLWRKLQWRHILGGEHLELEDITLGQIVHDARLWAQDEIDKVKGRKTYGDGGLVELIHITLEDENNHQKSIIQEHIKTYSFAKAKEIQLQRMKTRGVSQTYLDRLDKTFEQLIPSALKSKNLFEIDEDEIRSAILSIKKMSNLKMLRSFIGQILDFPRDHGLNCKISSYDMRTIYTPEPQNLSSVIDEPQKLKALFEYLENEEEKWQQAFCLRLYFLMYAPMSKILAARWDQLQVNKYYRRTDNSFLYEKLDWVHGKRKNSLERIEVIAFNILKKAKDHGAERFGRSQYWFPSPSMHRHDDHIKSTSLLWERCLEDLNLEYISPKALRQEYHANRYHGLDFLVGTEDIPLKSLEENLAKLSNNAHNTNFKTD